MRPAALFCEKENRCKPNLAAGAPIAIPRLGESFPLFRSLLRARICRAGRAPSIPQRKGVIPELGAKRLAYFDPWAVMTIGINVTQHTLDAFPSLRKLGFVKRAGDRIGWHIGRDVRLRPILVLFWREGGLQLLNSVALAVGVDDPNAPPWGALAMQTSGKSQHAREIIGAFVAAIFENKPKLYSIP